MNGMLCLCAKYSQEIGLARRSQIMYMHIISVISGHQPGLFTVKIVKMQQGFCHKNKS